MSQDHDNGHDDGHDDQPTDRRRSPRFEVAEEIRATIRGPEGDEREATLKDISAGGAGLVGGGVFENDAFVELHMEGLGTVPARVARRSMEGVGLEFELDEADNKAEMTEELRKFRLAVAKQKF
ncbi:MAG: PilZ domain-containing protein [Rhodospirillales bacterium]